MKAINFLITKTILNLLHMHRSFAGGSQNSNFDVNAVGLCIICQLQFVHCEPAGQYVSAFGLLYGVTNFYLCTDILFHCNLNMI